MAAGAALFLVGLSCLQSRGGVPRCEMIPKESSRPGLGISGPLERHQAQAVSHSQSLDFCRTEMGRGAGGEPPPLAQRGIQPRPVSSFQPSLIFCAVCAIVGARHTSEASLRPIEAVGGQLSSTGI